MIKKGDALIFLPMAYRRYNAQIPLKKFQRVVAMEDEKGGSVQVQTSMGWGRIDETCLVHESCFQKVIAFQKQS